MLVGGQAIAQAKLGVVLEERIGPRGTAALVVHRPRCRREVAAVDRRAAGGVGHLQAVAKQLAQQPQIRRLAAAGAGARELEQRLQVLHAAHLGEVHARAIVDRQRLEEGDVLALALEDRLLVHQVDGPRVGLHRAVHRARLHAQPAAGTVLEIDLQGEPCIRVPARVDRSRREARRRTGERVMGVVA